MIHTFSVFKKNLNASKPSEHPPSGEEMSKGLGENIGCMHRDKTSSWHLNGFPDGNVLATEETTATQQVNHKAIAYAYAYIKARCTCST